MKLKAGMIAIAMGMASASLPFAAHADDDKGLPHRQVINAIEAAVKAYPGNVKEAEVDRKDDKPVVDVKIIAKDGKEKEIRIDAQSGKVMQ